MITPTFAVAQPGHFGDSTITHPGAELQPQHVALAFAESGDGLEQFPSRFIGLHHFGRPRRIV